MDKIKDELLSDAIKTALDYSYTIIKLKRAVFVMGVAIICLLLGYFI